MSHFTGFNDSNLQIDILCLGYSTFQFFILRLFVHDTMNTQKLELKGNFILHAFWSTQYCSQILMAILDIPRLDLNRIIRLITVRLQSMHSILPNILNNPIGSQISYHMVITLDMIFICRFDANLASFLNDKNHCYCNSTQTKV